MKIKIFFPELTFFSSLIFFLLLSCSKNSSSTQYTGSPEQLQNKWIFKTVKGVDVSSYNMYILIKTATEYQMYDGCNSGSGTFATGNDHFAQFSYPALTYMYCEIYKTVRAAAYIINTRKYSVTQTSLTLYDDKGNVLITAEKK